jgi:Flp pilus assembly protein TadD
MARAMTGRQSGGDVPLPIYLEIDAAMRAGDSPAAIALARRALGEGLRHPVLFNLRAYSFEAQGLYEQAVADLDAALAMAPDEPKLLVELGRCLLGSGDFPRAIQVSEAAIASAPGSAAAHYNLGCAQEFMGELEAAWSAYARASELDPSLVDAAARRAGLAARRGDHAEAHALAGAVLRRDPSNTLTRLALALADLSQKNFTAAETQARAVLDTQGTPQQQRASAMGQLADALDGQGRTAEAFALYTQTNGLLRTIFRQRFAGPGKETGRQIAARLAHEFAAIAPVRWREIPQAPRDNDALGLAFIVGFPRSGTTLLAQILGSHPGVVTVEERPVLHESITQYSLRIGGLGDLATISAEAMARQRAYFWANLRARGIPTSGRMIVDQTPINTIHLPIIAKLFPEAKIIFAMRDPRDVVLSCFRRMFALNPYVYEFLTLNGSAHFYDEVMRLDRLYRANLQQERFEIRNEDLIADFEARTRALCAFVGLEWNESMLNFSRRAKARRIATPSALQLRDGIRSDGVGHWRAYAGQLAPVLPVLAPWAAAFGYGDR